jgi:hypothetical protein
MSVSEWEGSISVLREYATHVPLQNLLSSSCPHDFIEGVNALVESMASKYELLIDVGAGSKVYEALEQCGIHRNEVETFARNYFDWRWVPYDEFLLQAIIIIYSPDIGLHIGSTVVDEVLPDLSYDSDGLLIRNTDEMSFVKDGVLYEDYYLQYSREFYRYNLFLSGGFLEVFTNFIKRKDAVNTGVAINPDIVLNKRYFFEYETRAFIRGPKSISIDKLRDPRFPEDRRGTVTEHQRVDDDPVKRLTFDVEKTQIMWSAQDNLKTIQIEEIVPIESRKYEGRDFVGNRYVHGIWDVTDECFSHYDGAVRVYEKECYQGRLDSDLKHYDGKPLYKKLFRLDSAIDLTTWCDMTARYFWGNELVEEYFDAES